MKGTIHITGRLGAVILWILVSMLLLAGAPAVMAGHPAGAGPDSAQTPSGEWQTLQPGAAPWYAFYYNGDGSQVEVRMDVVPKEPEVGADFSVWTPEAIERWGLGLEVEPIGRGAPDPSVGGSLFWSGGFTTPGTYYVVVEHTGSQPGPAYYLLEISGSGVSYSEPAPQVEPTPVKTQPKPVAPSKPAGRLAFQTADGSGIYVIDVDGEGTSSGPRRVADGLDPDWSPNGREIAFVRWREPRGIWVVDVDSGNEWRAFDWDEARWPSWSPDGGRILFSRRHEGRTEEVERCFWRWCFTLPADPHWKLGIVRTVDGTLTEPPGSDYSRAPDWSPTEERFVYVDEHGLRVQNEDGSVSYQIADDPRDTSPVWSPDGKRIAVVRRQHDHWEIYVMDADGRNVRRLTETPRKANGEVAHSASPAWSPDGQHIAFLTDRTGKWEIWVIRANGTQSRPMFEDELVGLKLGYAHIGDRVISWTE